MRTVDELHRDVREAVDLVEGHTLAVEAPKHSAPALSPQIQGQKRGLGGHHRATERATRAGAGFWRTAARAPGLHAPWRAAVVPTVVLVRFSLISHSIMHVRSLITEVTRTRNIVEPVLLTVRSRRTHTLLTRP